MAIAVGFVGPGQGVSDGDTGSPSQQQGRGCAEERASRHAAAGAHGLAGEPAYASFEEVTVSEADAGGGLPRRVPVCEPDEGGGEGEGMPFGGVVVGVDLTLGGNVVGQSAQRRHPEEGAGQESECEEAERVTPYDVGRLMREDRVHLGFGEHVGQGGGHEDAGPQPAGREGGIRQPFDDADLACAKPCAVCRPGDDATGIRRPGGQLCKHPSQRSPRACAIMNGVGQADGQQQVECDVDGLEQRMERDHAERPEMIAPGERRIESDGQVMAEQRAHGQQEQRGQGQQDRAAVPVLVAGQPLATADATFSHESPFALLDPLLDEGHERLQAGRILLRHHIDKGGDDRIRAERHDAFDDAT
jgi:hypothetical protein